MREQRIIIEIDHEGKLTAEADGFTGDTCLKELEKLLEEIATSHQSVQRKPDAEHQRIKRTRALSIGKRR